MLTSEFTVTDRHPSLPGHFPGNPIAPGVVILDHVIQRLLEIKPNMYVAGFPQVKLLQPVLPNVDVIITFKEKTETLYQFTCENKQNEKLVTGQVKLQQKGS